MGQEILNVVLVIFLAVIAGCIVAATIFFIQALRSIIKVADNINETTQGLRNRLQLKALMTIPALILALIQKFRKRG